MSPSVRRALAALLMIAVSSCVGPADDEWLPTEVVDEWVGELHKDNAGITATMSVTRTTFGAADPVVVTLTMSNGGRKAIRILRWLGPTAELEEPLFAVTRDGRPVSYIGPELKRTRPTIEDQIVIRPGQSVSQEVSLSGAYDFFATGAYVIRYEVANLAVSTEYGQKTGTLRSNELTLWIEGRSIAAPTPPAAGEIVIQGTITYNRCDATQQSLLVQAVSQATTYSTNSVTYLNGTPGPTPRYVTWFGAYSSSGWSTARSQFVSIQDAFVNKPLSFDCRCKQKNVYAYVYPTQPYTIYPCGAFWSAPLGGTDSKGGTLIHEMSHFTVTANTDDWAYGQNACKSLAISDPAKALNNADSHEYFAENTPPLQ